MTAPSLPNTAPIGPGVPATSAERWQETNRRCLELHVRRLRALLERRALWLRRQWDHDPRVEYAGQVVTDAHADWLLRGEDPVARERFHETDADALHARARADAALRAASDLAAGPRPPALDVLQRLFRLDGDARDALLMVLAPELDPAIGPLYAYLQDDMSRPFPTPQLVHAVLGLPPATAGPLSESSPLRRFHLVEVQRLRPHPGGSAALSLDERITTYLLGANRPDERMAASLRPVPAGPLTAAQRTQAEQAAAHLAAHRADSGEWQAVNLVAAPDSGQQELAQEICARLGIRLHALRTDPRQEEPPPPALLEREALLLQTAVYVEVDQDGHPPLPTVGAHPGLLLFLASRQPLATEPPPLRMRPAAVTTADRVRLWEQELGADAAAVGGLLPSLAEQYGFGTTAVRRSAQAARHRAELEQRPLRPADLWASCREAGSGDLDELAERVEPTVQRSDLVLLPHAQQQLDELVAQVRHRYTVHVSWAMAPGRGRGIAALFAGPSGTGKTMAAEVLADELDLALYRIDLAALISKYIGETEKNMRRVFDAARHRGALLFFDEADALFGKRTDVKDSHDRFANIEIDYLLQLMESYPGLSVLATNRRSALDRAFLRRLRFVVEFAFPDAPSRRRIWQRVFPPAVPLATLDLDQLARLEISGGSIRNIALTAAFLAAARDRPVSMELLMHAARSEYAKIEKLPSDIEFGEYLR